jgi:HK97 family phage portal protein
MNWFGWFRKKSTLENRYGLQSTAPLTPVVDGVPLAHVDASLQIATVWRAVEIISKTVSTMPIMVYRNDNGKRTLARETDLWRILHVSPTPGMTASEFFCAMIINLLLRGNAYAKIWLGRDGVAWEMSPLNSDQVQVVRKKDGTLTYRVNENDEIVEYPRGKFKIFHVKEMGNGTVGLSRLDFMRASLAEAIYSQNVASRLFANGGKPTGILTIDQNNIQKTQLEQLRESFSEMANGSQSRLFALPGNMKYQQVNLTPGDIELLSTRKFTVEEIGRWFGVPGLLLNQTEGTTTLGSSSRDIIEGFYKLTIRPLIVNIEQALMMSVLTDKERLIYDIEFNMDGLLRSSLSERMDIYSKAVQNGIYSRNECRQYENSEPFEGGDVFTAQSNLLPIDLLGKTDNGSGANNSGTQEPIAN